MEAETKGLRDDIWQEARAEASGDVCAPRDRLRSALRMAVVAAIFLLAFELPLAVDPERRQEPFDVGSIQMLTSTEAELIGALRRSLSSANASRVIVAVGALPAPREEAVPVMRVRPASAEGRPQQQRRGPRPVPVVRAVPAAAPSAPAAGESRSLSLENVISLIQIGERALRGPTASVLGLPQ